MDTVEGLMIYHSKVVIKGTTVSHNKPLCKYIILITVHHAEYKAIIGGPSVRGCTLYVTKYPCDMCAKAVIQAGITKVVYDKEGEMNKRRKRKFYDYESSRTIMQNCLGKIKLVLTIRFNNHSLCIIGKWGNKNYSYKACKADTTINMFMNSTSV